MLHSENDSRIVIQELLEYRIKKGKDFFLNLIYNMWSYLS